MDGVNYVPVIIKYPVIATETKKEEIKIPAGCIAEEYISNHIREILIAHGADENGIENAIDYGLASVEVNL